MSKQHINYKIISCHRTLAWYSEKCSLYYPPNSEDLYTRNYRGVDRVRYYCKDKRCLITVYESELPSEELRDASQGLLIPNRLGQKAQLSYWRYQQGITCSLEEYLKACLKHTGKKITSSVNIKLKMCLAVWQQVATLYELGYYQPNLTPSMFLLYENNYLKIDVVGIQKTDPSRPVPKRHYASVPPEHIGEETLDFNDSTLIWQLGCLFYEILLQKRPFQGDTPYDVALSMGPLFLSRFSGIKDLEQLSKLKGAPERHRLFLDRLELDNNKSSFNTAVDVFTNPDIKAFVLKLFKSTLAIERERADWETINNMFRRVSKSEVNQDGDRIFSFDEELDLLATNINFLIKEKRKGYKDVSPRQVSCSQMQPNLHR